MSNAEKILRTLDKHLKGPTSLTIYGRAALQLGFTPPQAGADLSLDVDAILPSQQSIELETDYSFWEALDVTNAELSPVGLYMTHLFEETQVILRPDWLGRRRKLVIPGLEKLTLWCPDVIDLILTKMMRGADIQDMADVKFLLETGRIPLHELSEAIHSALVPQIPEIETAFQCAIPIVLKLATFPPKILINSP
jgi:hypothetical protein